MLSLLVLAYSTYIARGQTAQSTEESWFREFFALLLQQLVWLVSISVAVYILYSTLKQSEEIIVPGATLDVAGGLALVFSLAWRDFQTPDRKRRDEVGPRDEKSAESALLVLPLFLVICERAVRLVGALTDGGSAARTPNEAVPIGRDGEEPVGERDADDHWEALEESILLP